ncbi:disulfide bond formation protein B [Marinomonas profundimaris]|uniref:disulfide bond formation protein B n=1 Tax=Marinomonas profundimaris TaxID=1208321 RepID=UPI0022841718|nr:disulfide bond formation protein B [Marinomonas profundimaris]
MKTDCLLVSPVFLVSPVLLVRLYMETVMKKKKKPCPNCLKARWLLLYLGCFALLAILVANQFLNKGM